MKRLKNSLLLLFILFGCLAGRAAEQVTLFVIGDSTAANKDLALQNPERGWAQMLPPFFDRAVKVENHARNGRSTKSFVTLGHWDEVEERMKEGDFLLIQFGHNDGKESDTVRYASPEDYACNLERYIAAARTKGVTPVLLTPVVRRWWKDGVLADSHGEYLSRCKRVAAETGVILIDAEALTRKAVTALGDEGSKPLFMNIAAGVCPKYPEGKIDNTHFTALGARTVATLIATEIAEKIPALGKHMRFWDLVVAKDGSGNFFTIGEAVAAAPDFCSQRETVIYIREGIYNEKLNIPATKRSLKLVGESVGQTVITYGDWAQKTGITGESIGTSGSATVFNAAVGFTAENITFDNSAGPVGQAVALLCTGDNQHYSGCRFMGNQDTLYLMGIGNRDGQPYLPNGRYLFENCYIEGTTDFIFGSATAYFSECTIHSKKNSYITAASTCKGQPYGFVFDNCRLTAADGVDKCYLGRPWRVYAQTIFLNCELGSHILPEGWHDWNKAEARAGNTYYAEYNNRGEGASVSARVKWSKRLTKKQAEKYTREAVLAE